MPALFGIAFAFVALFAWGFGDFFIQRTTRLVGSWKAIFLIGVVGSVALFPFVRRELAALAAPGLLLLGTLGIVVIFTALFDFEALRQGKIAIIEPIVGLELPLTVGLGVTLGREHLVPIQFALIALVFTGIVLAITTHHTHLHYHKRIFEKGVILAGVGAIGMALTNFLVGVASQQISPFMTIWFAHSLMAFVCGAYLIATRNFSSLVSDLRHHPKPIVGQSIFDNAGWLAFAFATTLIPISITTTISESYIALAALLGIFINREKLRRHQVIGIALAVIGVLALSYFSA